MAVVVYDKAMELHGAVRKWLDDSATTQKNEHLKANVPLIDLLFAFAVAKLDESTQAKKLLGKMHRSGWKCPSPPAATRSPIRR